MSILRNYIFTAETAMVKEEINEYGQCISIVFEKNRTIQVAMSKQKLIEYNLKHFGHSYRGAKDGSKAILGNINMYPIAINAAQDIFFFPSDTITAKSSVWIALHCLVHYEEYKERETKIYLTNGRSYIVPVSYKMFTKRVDSAHVLKSKMEQRARHMESYVVESAAAYETLHLATDALL